MKKLFEQHSSQNEKQAKEALMKVASSIISKYVIMHESLNSLLAGGKIIGTKGKQDCLCCAVFKFTKKMEQLESQVGQIRKVYKLAFGEEMPVDDITEEATKKYYPLAMGSGERREDFEEVLHSKLFPGAKLLTEDEMPDEVREMIEKLTGAMNSSGREGHFSVSAVAIPKGTSVFGVNPKDFDNFEDYRDAVTKARKAHKNSGKYDKRTGEEIIKENVIANTEEFVAQANAEAEKPTRRRTSGSKGTPKEPKLN